MQEGMTVSTAIQCGQAKLIICTPALSASVNGDCNYTGQKQRNHLMSLLSHLTVI